MSSWKDGSMDNPNLSKKNIVKQQTTDKAEIAQFSEHSEKWWDPEGPLKPLHHMNPTRIKIIADNLADHFSRDLGQPQPFKGLSLCDIGCGGGLATEPFARLGFNVTGIDPVNSSINVAKQHAKNQHLQINYKLGAPEDAGIFSQRYDVVLALEVIEHVTNIPSFIQSLAKATAPGGLVIISTINRTSKSMLFGKIMAEYVLNWVPKGTHSWTKFVKPSELAKQMRQNNLIIHNLKGIEYNLSTSAWTESNDVSINYIISAVPQ